MPAYPIGHVAICVSDLDRAVQFYQQLGFTLSYQTADMAYFYCDGQPLEHDSPDRQGIALMRVGSTEAKPHIGFSCSSAAEVEQRHQALIRQGVKVTAIQRIGEAIAFYGQDPSGNWFEYLFEPQVTPVTQRQERQERQQQQRQRSHHQHRRGLAHSSRSKGFG